VRLDENRAGTRNFFPAWVIYSLHLKSSGWLRHACQLRLTFPLRLKAYRKEGSLACGEKCNAFFILADSLADPELFICNEYGL
jgi:hypothetical protein